MKNFYDYNFELDNQVRKELDKLISLGRVPNHTLLAQAQRNAFENQTYGQYTLEHFQRNSEDSLKYVNSLKEDAHDAHDTHDAHDAHDAGDDRIEPTGHTNEYSNFQETGKQFEQMNKMFDEYFEDFKYYLNKFNK